MDVVQDEVEVEIEVTPAPEEQDQLAFVAQFTPFPFTHNVRNAIFARRSLMDGELVFDLLLEQASIASPQSLYPPDSPESLLHLINAIANCPWDTLKKSCLQFYLLSHISSTVAAEHAVLYALPPQFVHLAHACFLLDSGSQEDLSRAVALLSDARIVQDLSSKVLHTLSLAPQPASSRLVRTYVRTAQPVLEAYEDLAIYLRALMEYNLADAWSFQRTFSETTPTRNQLIRTILDGCLIPPKPTVLPHLLSLPLTSFEFSLLQSYALSPPEELIPAAHAILQDLITVRLLHSGKYSDAVRISRAFDTLNTKSRTSAGTPLHKAAEERQRMMRDVLAVVPDVQRRELGDEQADVSDSVLGASWANVGSRDVSMSWENLGASTHKDKALRSGRLEGSPAPGRSNPPNAPFGPFTPAQKRKSSGAAPANIFGTPASSARPTPTFPTIPTPGLTAPSTPPVLTGFRQAPRFNFTPPAHQSPRAGAGLNARNAFFEPEPSRAGTALFGRPPPPPPASSSGVATPKKRAVDGEEKVSAGKQQNGERHMAGDGDAPGEDIMMVDSDDPDAFVVRGRRRQPLYQPQSDDDVGRAAENAPSLGTSLFGRTTRKTDEARRESETRVLPGGFTSQELAEDPPPAPSSQPPREDEEPSKESRSNRTRSRCAEADTEERFKIPGALFDDEDEQQDRISSLPSPPPPVRGGRRKRVSRANSIATESGDDDDHAKPLRRSSRLSSTEPLSPQKPEKTSKKAARDGAGRRKRKTTDE